VKLKIWFCLALLLSTVPATANAADNDSAPVRSLVDRPDDLSGYQIRLIYVVPSDVQDRNLDTNGTIGKWIDEVRKISRLQIGLTPRFDTYQNKFDIGFLKSKYTNSELVGKPGSRDANDLLRRELTQIEQQSLKGVGFIIDGEIVTSDYCGYAKVIGKYFNTWLNGSCWKDTAQDNYRNYLTFPAKHILHEWIHNLGVTHTCVTDDLMWGSGCEAITRGDGNSIDALRENYVTTAKSGVDISQLPVWEETIKTGFIETNFQNSSKSANPSRNSGGEDQIWGNFNLASNWVDATAVLWECEVFTSTGVVLSDTITAGRCESKILDNFKIGTRIYMKVTAIGSWQRSSAVLVFDVLGEKGEPSLCTSNTCIFGETVKLDMDLCFKVQGYARLQFKKGGDWVILKTHKALKNEKSCKSAYPFFVMSTIKDLPIGIHIFRWTWAEDRAFSKSVTSYSEFQLAIKPEAVK
jgi:hypothetical protein